MSTDPVFAGIDLGTQSVKVSLVSLSGDVAVHTSAPLTSRRSASRHEQYPAAWIDATREAMARAVAKIPSMRRSAIAAVSTSSTSGTLALVDRDGVPQRPALMYDDARAVDLGDRVQEASRELARRHGYIVQPSWALTKLAWLSAEGLLDAGTRVVHQTDVISEAMASSPVPTDWSSALKTGYDIVNESWPVDVFERIGVPVASVPHVVPPGTVIGVTDKEWERATGMPTGTRIVAGMTDGCAAQLGAGALEPGDWHSVLGTTLVLKGVSASIVHDDAGAVYSHRAPHDDLWLPGGASNIGAGALTTLFPSVEASTLVSRAGTASQLGRAPIAYPLTGIGERFPIVHPDARGFIRTNAGTSPLAVTSGVGEPELIGAVLLGVAFIERLSLETLSGLGAATGGRYSASGGGTRSIEWTRLRANVLTRSISVPSSAEASVGMAALAAWGSGVAGTTSLPQVARSMGGPVTVVDPDDRDREALAERYEEFVMILTEKGWLS